MTDAELAALEEQVRRGIEPSDFRSPGLTAHEALDALVAEVRRLRQERAYFRDDYDSPAPDVFIQWKGTTVCGDFTCKCGNSAHICGQDFMYWIHCQACDATWEVPHTIALREGSSGGSLAVAEAPADEDHSGHDIIAARGDTIRAAERVAEEALRVDNEMYGWGEPREGCNDRALFDAIHAYRKAKGGG